MKQTDGVEENASKEEVASSAPDGSIGTAGKLSVAKNRRVIIQKKRLNSASTSTSRRDRITSPEKTENFPKNQTEIDCEIIRKQKRKMHGRKSCPNKRQDCTWKSNNEEETL